MRTLAPAAPAPPQQKPSAKDLAKLGVCHPGQSYNPTPEDHQDVLAGAVAVELRRQEAIDQEAKPVSAGMSKETLELLIGDEVCVCVCVCPQRGGYSCCSPPVCVRGKVIFMVHVLREWRGIGDDGVCLFAPKVVSIEPVPTKEYTVLLLV